MAEDQSQNGTQPKGMEAARKSKPTVVGIGASAGGLAALKRLFQLVPADSGLVFVVVVHLSPEHKSHLADLLQPSLRIPVQQVTETVSLEPNHVYVIPPNANLTAIDTHLRLDSLEQNRRERAPVDHFFRTLAKTHDGHAIGVILTGTGSDGTLGLREVKAKGGVILVQDPNEAEFDGMPQSAIATGLVDRILPLAEIPEVLVRLASIEPGFKQTERGEEPAAEERILLPKALAILKTRTERDFSRYKPATLLRRIARRMQLNYIQEFETYLERLRDQPEEARALADDLLINVTSFFRDPDVFQKLQANIVPHLFEGKVATDTVRVWSVGCATGEEAYSLAMVLLEEAARQENPPQIQIFASDLHKLSLDSAREGLYSGDIETDVKPERLKRFFQEENGGYRICKEVRDLVVFAPHNLLSDPPFSRLDLIACRNLLIYLDRAVQRDIIDLFHYALCPNGYLLLGSAETIDASDLFRTEDKKLCMYRKRNVPVPEPRLPVFPLTRFRVGPEPLSFKAEATSASVPYQSMHQNLLERFAPPSILVGPDNKLVHSSQHAGRYLMIPGGEATTNALRLVREELRVELQGLLQAARERRIMLDSRPISVRFNGHSAPVVMHIRPAQDSEQEGFVLVIFEEHQEHADAEPSREKQIPAMDAESDQLNEKIRELEAEIAVTRQRLQITIEEYETSREEMKASHEEMQSTNEELRSTMEELETSKEELQSINEELQTVNQENRHKVEELSQLSSDLQNLLSSTDIATLFLDRDFRILRFTPKLADLFNVRVTDRGRPISDLTHRLGYGQLRDDSQAVLERLIPIEREIHDDTGRWYLTRVLPYRSTEDRIEGVVITFVEITDRKLAEEQSLKSERKYRRLFENIDEGFAEIELLRDLEGRPSDQLLLEINPAFGRLLGIPVEKARGRTVLEVLPNLDRSWVETYGQIQREGRPYRFERYVPDVDRWYDVNVVPDEESRLVLLYDDITERKRAEAALRASEERQAFLLKLSDAVRPLVDAEQIRLTACRLTGEHLGASRAYYIDFDTKQNAGIVSEDYRAEGLPSLAGTYPFETFRSTYKRIDTGITWVVPDVDKAEEIEVGERDFYKSQQVVAWANIPLAKAGRLEAAFCIVQTEPRQWTEQEIALIENVAERLWSAVERAHAEAALRESEENQRRLLERIPQLVWRSKDDGFWTWSSPQWQSFTGQTIEQSVGRGWLKALHPDDIEAALAAWNKAAAMGIMEADYRIRHQSSGLYRYFHTRAVLVRDEEGAVVEWFGTSTDIEDLKQAEAARHQVEQRFRLFVDNVQEYGLVQTDASGRITNWNPGAQRLFGYAAAEVVGRDFAVLMTEKDQVDAVFRDELENAREGHRSEDARWFVRSDGTQFWARWITEPMQDETGRFVGLAKIMRDETERERTASITRSALAEKEELLKEVHHRVKNNLQVITSLLNLQADQIADKNTLATFDEARNRVASIAAIHELLYRSSSLAAINLTDYARAFAPNLLNFFGAQNRIDIVVSGDGARLELERAVPYGLLLNELLSNALKHAFPDDRKGAIRISLQDKADTVLLRVADDGIGLPADFDIEKTPSLGLKLVKRLARQLRGQIRFERGKAGTVVEVQFPIVTS